MRSGLGDHGVALVIFVFSRQQVGVAQHVLVGVEVELAVALENGLLGDFILQRLVADADAEMARLFADQLLLDQSIDRFLAKVDRLEHGLRVGAVHLLHSLADLSRFAIDLVAEDLAPVDGRDRMNGVEQAGAKAPKGHHDREDRERDLHLPRILVTANSF